jgi:hypothetical protein
MDDALGIFMYQCDDIAPPLADMSATAGLKGIQIPILMIV